MFDMTNLTKEYFTNINDDEILDIKGLSTEDKVTCFKFFLTEEAIRNRSVVSNIFLLLNGVASIDDDALKDERVFFNSLEEYVDVKLQIREELDNFNIRLLEYYLGIIEGLDVVLDEIKVHMTNTYFTIMPLMTPRLISKIMLKYLPKIDVTRVAPVHFASEFYSKINNYDSFVMEFIKNISTEGLKLE